MPHAIFAADEAETAFRMLQASSHIGKLVIRPPAAGTAAAAAAPEAWKPDPGGRYLVVGGVQGFGLECAKWLAAGGAAHLVLVSRRGGTTPGAEAALRTLAALGARARIEACDAADEAALAVLLARLRRDGPPIRLADRHAPARPEAGACRAHRAAARLLSRFVTVTPGNGTHPHSLPRPRGLP